MRTREESFVGSRSASSESGMPEHRLTSECAECSPTLCRPQGLKRGFATQDGLGRRALRGRGAAQFAESERHDVGSRRDRDVPADRRTDTSSAMRATRCSCRTATAPSPSTRRPRQTGPGHRRKTTSRSRSRACHPGRRQGRSAALPTRPSRSSLRWRAVFSDSAQRDRAW